jgi:mono/diheme cytochrome c family protein
MLTRTIREEAEMSVDDDDVREPIRPGAGRRGDQEIFDDQIARASGKFIIQLGGLGILAALVMSAVALIVAAHRSNTTVTVPAAPTGGQATQLKGDALGEQIFVSGTPGGAEACGSCHTMSAAGTSGTTGPNLDKALNADPPSSTRESIVDPNKEIVPGYRANVMPPNYGTALTPQQLDAVVNYVYHSTNTKFRRSKTAP